MTDAPHVVPPVWVNAYNDWVAVADRPDAPDSIALPAVILPPGLVRQILKVFDPSGDF